MYTHKLSMETQPPPPPTLIVYYGSLDILHRSEDLFGTEMIMYLQGALLTLKMANHYFGYHHRYQGHPHNLRAHTTTMKSTVFESNTKPGYMHRLVLKPSHFDFDCLGWPQTTNK